MPNEQEPVQTTETVSAEVNGSQAGEQSATPTDPKPEVKTEQPQTNEELEALRKQLNQANMRANQLENQRKEEERKRLEEANEYKTLYEQTQADLKAREEREAQTKAEQEAQALRDSVIDSYDDPKVKEAAKRLLETNPGLFYWTDSIDSEDAARGAVKSQLDAMRGVFSPSAEEHTPAPVSGNNPLPTAQAPAESTRKSADELKAMADRLSNVVF